MGDEGMEMMRIRAGRVATWGVIVALILYAVVFVIEEGVQPFTSLEVVFHVLMFVAIACLLFAPRLMAVCIFAVVLIAETMPYTFTSTFLGIIMLMIACFVWGCEESNMWLSVFLPLFSCFYVLLVIALQGQGSYAIFILFIFLIITPWLAGFTSRRQRKERENILTRSKLEQAESKLRQQERDNRLAQAIHDSVTGDISAILLLASDDQVDLNQVRDVIVSKGKNALGEVHQVIDLLDGKNLQQAAAGVSHALHELSELCSRKDAEMERLQITGKSAATEEVNALPIPNDVFDVAASLVNEIYANIVRHCAPGTDTYSVTLKTNNECLVIMETNTTTGTRRRLRGAASGKGLAYQKQAIERVGGTLSTNLEAESWIMYCSMPLVKSEQSESLT